MQMYPSILTVYNTYIYGKLFNYLIYKSDIWFNISDILYNI